MSKPNLQEMRSELDKALKVIGDGMRERTDAQLFFDFLTLMAIREVSDGILGNEKVKEDVEGVKKRVQSTMNDIRDINRAVDTLHGELAWDDVYVLSHMLQVYDIAWLDIRETEAHIQARIFNEIDYYIPGAVGIKKEFKIGNKRCDILAEIEGEQVLVEVKKHLINNKAVKQLKWYMDHSGIKKGILMGSMLSPEAVLLDGMEFVSHVKGGEDQ